MTSSFEDRLTKAWSESQWIIDEMFNHGMCLFEGYIPGVDLRRLNKLLSSVTDDPSSLDCSGSVWDQSTNQEDRDRIYTLGDYVSFFQSGRIGMLHADYVAACSDYSFTFKLILTPEADLEVICYRENLLPRTDAHDRFRAACLHLKELYDLSGGKALFLGPDTLNYPNWPEFVPNEWQRLL